MRYYLAPLAAAVLGFSASHASPLKFDMGSHSAGVIQSACNKAGGSYSSGSGGGYGCMYPNGGEVMCDKTSKCTGYTAREIGHGAGRMGLDNAMKAIASAPQGGGAPGSHANMAGATSPSAPLGTSQASMNTRATTATSPLNSSGGALNAGTTRATLTKQQH